MKQYGFVTPSIDSDHYVLGAFNSLPKIILQPSGQWDEYLPVYEAQADKYETFGCTSWGTLNALEILEKRITGIEQNYSDRYVYNLVPIRSPGADPHVVAETIRNYGLVKNEVMGMTDTYEEFCSPTPMTSGYIKLGSEYPYKLRHEWVFTNVSKAVRVPLMKEALQYSPLGVSVTAWNEKDGLYVDNGLPNNHWCVCYGYYEKDGETYFKIFDSYDHSLKVLHPDHTIFYAKRYLLGEKEKEKESCLSRIMGWLSKDERSLGVARSPKWKAFRDSFIAKYPACAFCDTRFNPEAHHLRPFHLSPELELAESNLVTLCGTHHYELGHFFNWRKFNSDIINWINKKHE